MKKIVLFVSLILNLVLAAYVLFYLPDKIEPNHKEAIEREAEKGTRDEKGDSVDPVNIVMLGNSITYQGDWQKVLGRQDIFNGGKPGWTTQQLSWVIKDFIIPNHPKLCFFKGGINDYTLGISTNRVFQNITLVMDSIAKVGTHPIYTTTLYQRGQAARNQQIDSLNYRMENFCRMRGYDFLDLRPFLCKDGDILDEYVKEDNTHLEPEAYPQWARAMQPILNKYGL